MTERELEKVTSGSDQSQTGPQLPSPTVGNPPSNTVNSSGEKTFPDDASKQRLMNYEYYNRLLLGEHFEAFNIRIADERFTREYSKMRYVTANFAGLISKVCADMLMGEAPRIYVEDDKPTQEFIDALVEQNSLDVQNYESALGNSSLGDAVYRLRVGPRNPNDPNEPSTVIIEDMNPAIYFPVFKKFNTRAAPIRQDLCWTFKVGQDEYLRQESHFAGYIENHIYKMEGQKIIGEVPLSAFPELANLQPVEPTGVNVPLVIHIPNYKTGRRNFGISDYYDLDTLFFGVNNRLTKVDNILDKHGDPILTVPPGVLDEEGNVNKKALGVIEVREGESGKPEYVVWDAKLDAAFDQIDKMIEFLFMFSEVSPDALGMGKGQSDSGRALKLKLLRTIAKVNRKKLYYDEGIKKVIYTAMLLAKTHDLEVGGLKLTGEPKKPEIEWYDGLPIDNSEQVEIEAKRLDSGNTTIEDSIMRLDGVDEETAKKKASQIKEANAITLPESKLSTPFGPNGGKGKQESK